MRKYVDIPGYEGLYIINDIGEIWSCYGKHSKRILGWLHSTGYQRVSLIKESTIKSKYIHRLVLYSFIGGGDNLQVNHINGIKTDNRLENLEWCTSKENNKHAKDFGLNHNYGEKHRNAKLSCDDVRAIREQYNQQRVPPRDIAKAFNISASYVWNVVNYVTWRRVL